VWPRNQVSHMPSHLRQLGLSVEILVHGFRIDREGSPWNGCHHCASQCRDRLSGRDRDNHGSVNRSFEPEVRGRADHPCPIGAALGAAAEMHVQLKAAPPLQAPL
jgi:hypothetical protein